MSSKNKIKLMASVLFFILVYAIYLAFTYIKSFPQKENANDYCKSLSSNISSEMLSGVWIAEPGTGIDKIIIQPDHTFSQVYINPVTQISFMTNLNNWELEYTGGITYIYLSNMRKCDSYENICLLENGGGGESSWINFCTGELAQMKNSVTLIVFQVKPGDIYYPLSDLKLCHFLSDPDGNAVCFRRLIE